MASLGVAIVLMSVLAGCQKDVEIPPIEVKEVEAYGVKLDESATPQQVVYVLLRSLRDDFEAAQARDRQRQKEAFHTTFSLAAFSEIEKCLAKTFAQQGGGKDSTSLGAHRDRKIYDVVYHWAPIVGHYVRSFDVEQAAAVAKMRMVQSANGSSVHVNYDVSHDPQETEPTNQQLATLDIELVEEKASAGSRMYWRVARVAFHGPEAKRRIGPASRPEVTATSPG